MIFPGVSSGRKETPGQAIAENQVSDKIMLIGFDSDDKTVKLLADGNIKALIVQDPFRMGYEGIKTALAASKGEKVPESVDTGASESIPIISRWLCL